MEQFDSTLSSVIDSTLGLRCSSFGYQYSEIVRSLMSIYFCGGSCIEDVTTHLMNHLSLHPTLRTCSSDTILRAIKELTQGNISYTSDTGKNYDFNTADTLNTLLLNCMFASGQLKEGEMYDVDFDHQFIETEKYDAKPTYKKFLGYRPGVAVIDDLIVGIENSDGNTNVRFHQKDTLKRFFERFEQNGLTINRFRADCGSTEKYDAKPTYKKFLGYRPGVAVIDDLIVGIENSDGNTNVRFHQKDTLKRFFERFEQNGLTINRFRADCGSCSEEIVEEIEKHSKSFYIRANRCSSLYNDIFALRGWKTEEINGIEFELNSILVEKWKGKAYRLVIQRQKRMDGVLDLWEGEYTYRCILTNDYESSTREIVEFYNLRGGKERIFDDMNNGFGWDRLPKSFMAENTVFLLLTALIRNFYKAIIHRLDVKRFGLNATSRIKAFVFRFVSVPAKWIRTSRRYVLNIYTCNNAYADIFQTDFG